MRIYSLDNFWAPPDRDGHGLGFEKVRSVHKETATCQFEGTFGGEYVWFIHIEDDAFFDFYLYDAKQAAPDLTVDTVEPFVQIHGSIREGVKACWFSDTEPSDLRRMADALTLADAEIRNRGWAA